MILERTISQLDIGPLPDPQARELGRLGYLQWLGALPGEVSYPAEVRRALTAARPFALNSPAVGVFCDLLWASLELAPLELEMPVRARRGGAEARRRRVR